MGHEFRERPAGDIWWNRAPVTDVDTALAVLKRNGHSTEPTHLRRTLTNDGFFWEIVVPWYREGSSGADTWGENYYEIDPAVAEALKKQSLVEPHVVKIIGHRAIRPNQLVITSQAIEESFERDRERRKSALSFLTPGITADLMGDARELGSGREDNDAGRYYVNFETPQGDTCRVYPDQGEVVCPYPPPETEAEAA